MSVPTPRIALITPLVVCAAAAATAEMAVGLLLYIRAGFLAALTVILCVQMSALALGLWCAPRDTAPPWRGLRRAWFLLLLTYAAGAVLAASWEVLGGLATTWASRGVGLAFLAALPLYATGLVLGAPALIEGSGTESGAAAAIGAALGFAAVGLGGSGLRLAVSAYVAAMGMIAVGALLHARVLGAHARRWQEWAEHGTARAGVHAAVAGPAPASDPAGARQPPAAPGAGP